MTADIATIRANALERINELVATPKPTYTVDGQTVNWNEYMDRLKAIVDWCDAQTAAVAEPVEVTSQAFT